MMAGTFRIGRVLPAGQFVSYCFDRGRKLLFKILNQTHELRRAGAAERAALCAAAPYRRALCNVVAVHASCTSHKEKEVAAFNRKRFGGKSLPVVHRDHGPHSISAMFTHDGGHFFTGRLRDAALQPDAQAHEDGRARGGARGEGAVHRRLRRRAVRRRVDVSVDMITYYYRGST